MQEFLGLWLSKRPLLPRAHAPPDPVRIDYLDYQIPSAHDYLIDPEYPIDSWLNKKNPIRFLHDSYAKKCRKTRKIGDDKGIIRS